MDNKIVIAIAIGLGLSASCGFRVFVPMLQHSELKPFLCSCRL